MSTGICLLQVGFRVPWRSSPLLPLRRLLPRQHLPPYRLRRLRLRPRPRNPRSRNGSQGQPQRRPPRFLRRNFQRKRRFRHGTEGLKLRPFPLRQCAEWSRSGGARCSAVAPARELGASRTSPKTTRRGKNTAASTTPVPSAALSSSRRRRTAETSTRTLTITSASAPAWFTPQTRRTTKRAAPRRQPPRNSGPRKPIGIAPNGFRGSIFYRPRLDFLLILWFTSASPGRGLFPSALSLRNSQISKRKIAEATMFTRSVSGGAYAILQPTCLPAGRD